ncbi:MAG: hypothetical protein IT326_03450 [Anaerolineae bacterium]|nr:hypothetical protein [Anaerolineae bacterium]
MSIPVVSDHQIPWRGALARLNGWFTTLDGVQRLFLLLIGARWLIVILLILNALPLELRDPFRRFYFHHGGDNDEFFALALSVVAGKPVKSIVGFGAAMMMIPWIVLLKPWYYVDIIVPLVITNAFILGGFSVLAVGVLARRLTKDDRIAATAAALWALLPLLTYFAFFWHFDPVILRSVHVPKLAWMNGLSDGPATFYLLLAAMTLSLNIERGKHPSLWQMAGAGAAMGLAVTFRIHVAPAVACMLGYVLLAHGWKALAVTCAGGLVAYIPQGWYNQVAFGIPITTGYISAYDYFPEAGRVTLLDRMPFSPRELLGLWDYFVVRRPWVLIPLALAAAAVLFTVWMLWRERGWRAVALGIAVPVAYLGPIALSWPFRDDPIRFAMPSYPYLLIACLYAVRAFSDILIRRGVRVKTPPTPPQSEI